MNLFVGIIVSVLWLLKIGCLENVVVFMLLITGLCSIIFKFDP